MEAYSGDRDDLIKEIKRIRKNLNRRVNRLKSLNMETSGTESYDKFLKRRSNDLRNISKLDDTKLTTLYRDIKYIDDLKSVSFKGAKNYYDVYVPIKEKLEQLSPSMRSIFKEIYNKLIEENAMHLLVKYEEQEAIIEMMSQGNIDVDANIDKIRELFDKAYESTQLRGEGNEYLRLQITKNLRDFLDTIK